jgi:hypothetical protein
LSAANAEVFPVRWTTLVSCGWTVEKVPDVVRVAEMVPVVVLGMAYIALISAVAAIPEHNAAVDSTVELDVEDDAPHETKRLFDTSVFLSI